MWFAYNCYINFCQFSPFIYRLCEHIPYNTIPTLCPLLKLMLHLCPHPPTPLPTHGGGVGVGATPLSAEFWFLVFVVILSGERKQN